MVPAGAVETGGAEVLDPAEVAGADVTGLEVDGAGPAPPSYTAGPGMVYEEY